MPQTLDQVAQILQEKFGFATTSQLDRAVADVARRTQARVSSGNSFSFSRAIRGSLISQGHCLNDATKEMDLQYVRALTPASGAGSYLVPTLQADQLIEMLATGSVVRAAGARIWPMSGAMKMNVPVALAAPQFQWLGPNSQSTAYDPDLGQASFDLKQMRCLVAVPNQLLRASVPQFDTILSDILGKGAGEFEDAALLATSDTANGPKCYYSAASTSKIFVGSSASGGNLAYGDLLACLAEAASVKAKGPFCWITGVRTFYTRILGLVDTSSRPICVPTLSTGLAGGIQYQLFGWPVYISPNVKEDETNSNGSAQSHIIFTNPSYLHIADGGDFAIQVSLEFLFDKDQTAIRLTHSIDSAVAPAAGVVILAGVN